ncbi:MAG: hypothetical protein WA610_05195 [Thermodesulfovibrionales bacterium]
MVSVQGIGYPPIRAESTAQAHLMAKRAAVVNAYRNVLSANASSGNGSDVTYQELSGFVSGMKIVDEEYLKDGGIRITAKVPKKNVVVSSKPRTEVRRSEGPSEGSSVGFSERSSEKFRGPERVSLDEWYKIINRLVSIDK